MDNSLPQTQTAQTSTFSQNSTDLLSLKSIQNIFLVLKSDSQHGDILHPEYQKLLDLLTSLNTHSSPEKCFCDPAAKTFFLDKLIPTIAKTILGIKKKYSDDIQDILYNCLQQITLLCLNSFSESQNSLVETAFAILDLHKPYYSHPIPSRSSAINSNSYIFGDLISYIKSKGVKLFERIYEIVSDTKNMSSIKLMSFVCLIACKLKYFYSQELARDHMNRIREAVHHRLFNNASLYISSFGFTDYKVAVKGLKVLFKASIASDEERHKVLDIIKLQISKICLSSDNESSNDLGFRIIQDVIADLENQRSSQFKVLSKPACHEFLRKIFDDNPKALFRNMRVQKSPKLFRVMFKYDLLRSHEYQSLWLALKRGKYISQYNQKLSRLIRKLFPREQLYSLLKRLILENFKSITEDVGPGDIRLISAIYYKYPGSNILTDMVEKFFWEIMVNNDRIKDQQRVMESLIAYYRRKIGSAEEAEIVEKLDECLENIENNTANFTFFRIIQNLPFCHFTEREYAKQKKVLHLLMEHIRLFKAQNSSISNITNESSYLNQISEKLNCLNVLLKMQLPEKPNLTYELLEEIWIMFVDQALFPAERDLFFAMLSKVMKSYHEFIIESEDLKKFFEQKLLNKDTQKNYLRMSKDGATCFHAFLIALNRSLKKIWISRFGELESSQQEYAVKVAPEELEGFDGMWSFVMSCEDTEASYRATDIVALTYDNLEDQFEPDLNSIRERLIARCFEYMRPSSPTFSSSCCLKGLEIIKKMMYDSGRKGILELDGHTKLQKSDIFELSLDVSIFNTPEDDNNYIKVIKCSSNSTVVELMKKIAKIINVDWEVIGLSQYFSSPQPRKIGSAENGFTLSDAGIRKYDDLRVLRSRLLQRAELLRDSDTLSSRAKAVFTRLFEQFSDNGKMSIEQCTAYIHSCTNDYPRPTDGRTKSVFEDYDLDKDNYLTLDDFLKFYTEASNQRTQVVRNNLDAHKIRYDLRDVADIKRQENNKQSLISYIIRSNNEYYQVLFSLLDREEDKELVSEAWKVLNRLPTSPQIFEDLVRLKGVRDVEEEKEKEKEDHTKQDWNAILHLNSKYKTLYLLNIVDYLMHYNDENTEKIASLEYPELIEYMKNWQKDFIKYGGLENLAGVFGLFKPDETNMLKRPYKRVYAFSKTMNSKLKSILMNTSEEEKRSKILSFMTVLSEYESCFVKSEQTVAANKMRRTILKLKQKRSKCSV